MKADWELIACGLRGHATYRPDEPEIAAKLRADTPAGTSWRCLRCAEFVPGEPAARGPIDQAPAVSRGTLLRDTVIMRLLALDRFVHFLALLTMGATLLGMRHAEEWLHEAYQRDLPLIEPVLTQLGWNVAGSATLRKLDEAFDLSPTTITWIAVALLAYALLELIEATGLWVGRRWGEYFSVVVTGVFIPFEIYELVSRVTALKLLALAVNVAAVIWLIWRKRLFGARGGEAAYRAEHRSLSVLAEASEQQAGTDPTVT